MGESVVAREFAETNEQPPSPGQWEGLAPVSPDRAARLFSVLLPVSPRHVDAENTEQIVKDLRENRPFASTPSSRPRAVACIQSKARISPPARLCSLTSSIKPYAAWSLRRRHQPRHSVWLGDGIGSGTRRGRPSSWPECYERGLALIGWDSLGDLRQYRHLTDIEAKLWQKDEGGPRPVNKSIGLLRVCA